jgi:peptide/nickel transport system permease protein
MYQYILRRILISIPVLIIISIILFTMVQLAPGDPFSGQLNPKLNAKYFTEMRHKFGLDKPKYEQYLIWAKNFLMGEYGISFSQKVPVSDLISDRIGNTFFLAVTSLIITYSLAIPIGVFQAERPYSKLDYTITTGSFVGLSLPSFFAGLLSIYLFSFILDWFPSSGTMTAGADYTGIRLAIDKLHHVLLPATTLALINVAAYTRYVRASVMEAKQQDFVRTALAKGLARNVVLKKHVLRNSLLPLITLFGIDIGLIFSGAIITETIFSWPGLGKLLFDSVVNRDYPILMACSMLIAVFVILGNLLADILYAVVDPRIRYD